MPQAVSAEPGGFRQKNIDPFRQGPAGKGSMPGKGFGNSTVDRLITGKTQRQDRNRKGATTIEPPVQDPSCTEI